MLLITPLTGLVLLSAIWVAATATTFWLVEGRELPNAVTYGSGMFTSYPVSVFSGRLLRLMASVVPGAFVQQLAFSTDHTTAADLITAVAAAQVPVRDLQVVEPSIEDVVRSTRADSPRSGSTGAGRRLVCRGRLRRPCAARPIRAR